MKKIIISFFLAQLLSYIVYAQKDGANGSMMNFGVGSLPLIGDVETRSITAENPTGEKGKGAMAVPDVNNPNLPFAKWSENLGQGWKVSPFLKPKCGETVTLMDVDGPGIIQHIWITCGGNFKGLGRACILRFYWDNEKEPSIEVPITDFFAVGHDEFAKVNSAMVVVNPVSSLNCWWPMPFRKHAKITFTNEGDKQIDVLPYQITYALTDVPENATYFHAQWRKSVIDTKNPDYTILDNVKGKGKYVGTFLAWTQLHSGWWGEGEVKFYMDGDKKFPTICGTGTEDYFCATYGFPEVFSTAYSGNTLDSRNSGEVFQGPRKWSLYRWHVLDPIFFKKDLKVTIQSLGWNIDGQHLMPLDDDIASTAFWYQVEPHYPFPKLPELKDRWPR
jgi:hypothetical protein